MKSNKYLPVCLFFFSLIFLSCSNLNNAKIEQGDKLLSSNNYLGAIETYQKGIDKNPDNKELQIKLFRAKLQAYLHFHGLAKKNRELNRKEQALDNYEKALEIFPDNKVLIQEINNYKNPPKVENKSNHFKSKIIAPVELKISKEEKINLKLKDVPISRIYKTIGKFFDVNIIFDKSFKDFVYSIELDNVGFYEVVEQLCAVSNSDYRVMDKRTIIVFPKNHLLNKLHSLNGIGIFYLSNARAKDMKKHVLTLFRDYRIITQEDVARNALLVKGSAKALKAVEKFLKAIDVRRDEVLIDVQILEVNRGDLKKIGSTIGNEPINFTSGISEGEAGKINSTINLDSIGKTNFYASIPPVALHFLENDNRNKILAKPNLRGLDGEEIKFMVGEEIPIPNTQFMAYATGGAQTIPQTTYQYKNVGLTINITPYVHDNREISIKIKLTMNFVASYNKDNFPILGKREIENVIRLKEGETNIIGGFIREEERKSLNGTIGLLKIPLLGRLFGKDEKEVKSTDVIISLTPRIIRTGKGKEIKTKPIWN